MTEAVEGAAKQSLRLNIPEGALLIMPMRNRVLFPSMVMPLDGP